MEQCFRTNKVLVNPIIDWTDGDVWDFLHAYGCEGNPLYQTGFGRIGCIGCPMADKRRYVEFALYPKYREAYVRAFDEMLKARNPKKNTVDSWQTGEEVMRWWLGEDPNQITIDDYLKSINENKAE